MIICIDTDSTCATGETPNDAYEKYIEDNDVSVHDSPEKLRWFRATLTVSRLNTKAAPNADA